jgi:hypothetical protein
VTVEHAQRYTILTLVHRLRCGTGTCSSSLSFNQYFLLIVEILFFRGLGNKYLSLRVTDKQSTDMQLGFSFRHPRAKSGSASNCFWRLHFFHTIRK